VRIDDTDPDPAATRRPSSATWTPRATITTRTPGAC